MLPYTPTAITPYWAIMALSELFSGAFAASDGVGDAAADADRTRVSAVAKGDATQRRSDERASNIHTKTDDELKR
jgi:hypothetical protein